MNDAELIMDWVARYICIIYACHTYGDVDRYVMYMTLLSTLLVAMLLAINEAQLDRISDYNPHHLLPISFCACLQFFQHHEMIDGFVLFLTSLV